MAQAPTAERLLADAAWLRRLAERLAGDSDADDLVQETWIAAWRRQPSADRPLRPWLGKVMRDTARMRRRTERRRELREASAEEPVGPATPDELLEQVRLHQLLVELVLALEEPFRSTILSRFVEGRSSAEIARANEVSEGTVRWRLHEALQRLRHQLDERRGARKNWAPAVLAFAKGTIGMAKTSKISAGVVLLILLLLCGVLLVAGGERRDPSSTGRASSAPAAARKVAADGTTGTRSMSNTRGSRPWWEVEGVQLHGIRGRVITRDGEPIANAHVELHSWAGVVREEPDASLTTHADGTFSFTPTAAAMFSIVASADGRASRAVRVDPRAPRNEMNPSSVVIILDPCFATVEGVVSDSGGGPIHGATLRFGTGVLAFGASATTDANGRYLACVSEDAAFLSAGADGYEHIRLPLFPRGKQRIDLTLSPEARIVGKLVDEGTGAPVSNAQVFVADAGDRPIETRNALSSEDGTFEIDGVAAGRVRLHVWSADHFMFDARDLTVRAGMTHGPILVKLPAAATVRGRVMSNGAPVVGASVQFYLPTSRGAIDSLRAVTGEDGSFVAINVGRGKGVIVGVRGVTVISPTTIDTTGGDVRGVAIDVSAPVTLHGRVERHHLGVAGAKVQIRAASGRSVSVETDLAGAFTAQAPDSGPCFATSTSGSVGAYTSQVLKLSCDHDHDDVLLVLDGGARLAGVVVDEEGNPVVGAFVKAVRERGDDVGKAITGTNGAFQIDQLAGAGTYKLTVATFDGGSRLAWAGAPQSPVLLRDGDANRSDLRLAVVHRVTSIEGIVTDDGGAAVADAMVRAVPGLGRGTASAAPPARTDVNGHFKVSVAGTGPFHVEAGIGARPRASTDGVRAGARDVTLRLTSVAGIRGTLVNLEGASVNVRATGLSDPGAHYFMANVDGKTFALDDLLPGTYAVLAVGRDGRTSSATISLAPGETRTLILTAASSRTLAGRVLSFDSKQPVAGVRCRAVASLGDLVPPIYWQQAPAVESDASGAFALENAPDGEAVVMCDGATGRSGAIARVVNGERARLVIVEKPEEALETPGFIIDWTRIEPRVLVVDAGGPAAAAGIEAGDVITSVDGASIEGLSAEAVATLIGRRGAGVSVTITFQRGAIAFERTLVVGPPEP